MDDIAQSSLLLPFTLHGADGYNGTKCTAATRWPEHLIMWEYRLVPRLAAGIVADPGD